jgi:hypothetical protein
MQLTEIESVFRTLKSELNLRPIFPRIQSRVEAPKPRLAPSEHLLASHELNGSRSQKSGAITFNIQLSEIEAVFRTLKTELNLRPIFHRI